MIIEIYGNKQFWRLPTVNIKSVIKGRQQCCNNCRGNGPVKKFLTRFRGSQKPPRPALGEGKQGKCPEIRDKKLERQMVKFSYWQQITTKIVFLDMYIA